MKELISKALRRLRGPLPPPDKHVIREARKVVEFVQHGGQVRFVDSAYDPGAYSPALVDGYWPLITRADIIPDSATGLVAIFDLEGQSPQGTTAYASLDEPLRVAPK